MELGFVWLIWSRHSRFSACNCNILGTSLMSFDPLPPLFRSVDASVMVKSAMVNEFWSYVLVVPW